MNSVTPVSIDIYSSRVLFNFYAGTFCIDCINFCTSKLTVSHGLWHNWHILLPLLIIFLVHSLISIHYLHSLHEAALYTFNRTSSEFETSYFWDYIYMALASIESWKLLFMFTSNIISFLLQYFEHFSNEYHAKVLFAVLSTLSH